MPKLTEAFAGLEEPSDLSLPFDRLLHELRGHVSDAAIVKYAVRLLDGADPGRFPTVLRYFGGAHAQQLLKRSDFDVWPAVWGARALQYVWTPKQERRATRVVLAHLDDPRWRVVEMCTKVVRKRELGEGGDALVPLTEHRQARVRMQAVRALGVVGETEHLPAVHARLEDHDDDVRREAKRALKELARRLDLDADRLRAGRFD